MQIAQNYYFSSLNMRIFDVVAVALLVFPRTVLSPPCPTFLIIKRPARYPMVFSVDAIQEEDSTE